MKKQRARWHGPATVGTTVLVEVAPPGISKADSHFTPGTAVHATDHQLCRAEYKGGVLKSCYPRETLFVEANKAPETYDLQGLADTWQRLPQASVRKALKHTSLTGGQGCAKCGCKGECKKSSCVCFKAGALCSSRCHAGSGTWKNW